MALPSYMYEVLFRIASNFLQKYHNTSIDADNFKQWKYIISTAWLMEFHFEKGMHK